jgi:hypothetical protein
MEIVAGRFRDAVERPEALGADGWLSLQVLQYAFDDEPRRADDERAVFGEEVGTDDGL